MQKELNFEAKNRFWKNKILSRNLFFSTQKLTNFFWLVGCSMFGGRGEYTCKLKLYDLGMDGGGYEKDGVLLVETDEVPYECAARSKHNIFLPKTINLTANRWYLIWARIAGPSSDCGSSGQTSITTEDQIVFNFRTSKKANNGTDVNSGQIPSILYRVINQESKLPIINSDTDPVHKVSQHFANSVTKDCFQSLITLLKWSWGTFKLTLNDLRDKVSYFKIFLLVMQLAIGELKKMLTNPNLMSTEKFLPIHDHL